MGMTSYLKVSVRSDQCSLLEVYREHESLLDAMKKSSREIMCLKVSRSIDDFPNPADKSAKHKFWESSVVAKVLTIYKFLFRMGITL